MSHTFYKNKAKWSHRLIFLFYESFFQFKIVQDEDCVMKIRQHRLLNTISERHCLCFPILKELLMEGKEIILNVFLRPAYGQ